MIVGQVPADLLRGGIDGGRGGRHDDGGQGQDREDSASCRGDPIEESEGHLVAPFARCTGTAVTRAPCLAVRSCRRAYAGGGGAASARRGSWLRASTDRRGSGSAVATARPAGENRGCEATTATTPAARIVCGDGGDGGRRGGPLLGPGAVV